jgi:hypothetical protein
MKYTITLFNKWKRPYFYTVKSESNKNSTCIDTSYNSYETTDLDVCKQIIKDFLDAPETELSLDAIRQEFSSPNYNISENKLVAIQNFYNGRLGMYNTIMRQIELLEPNEEFCKKYNIPYKYNYFSVECDETNEEQIDAFIELRIENNE